MSPARPSLSLTPRPRRHPTTEPTVTRIPTPPGSIVRVSVEADQGEEQTFKLAEELHRQTGLPVVVTTPGAEVDVTTREEAVAALAQALDDDALEGTEAGVPLAEAVLELLSAEGWELVRLWQP